LAKQGIGESLLCPVWPIPHAQTLHPASGVEFFIQE
jgi:hypothetical protein